MTVDPVSHEVGRTSDAEMKKLMQPAVNRAYAVLRKEDEGDLEDWALGYARSFTGKCDEPKADKA